MVSLDDSSSGEASSAGEDHQREGFVLPSDQGHSSRDRTRDATRRSRTAPPRNNGKGTTGDGQNQHSDEREGNPRHTRTPLRISQGLDEEDLEAIRRKKIAAQRNLPGRIQYQSEEAQELQHINDLLENPTRELARAPGYDLFVEEIAQRLRTTMARLEAPHRHQSGSRNNTTSSATSRSNTSPRRNRRNDESRRSPARRNVLRMSDDQQAPRRGDRSPIRHENLQQMEYEEYFPRRTEAYYRSGQPITGYRRIRSPGDINPSFLQRRRQEVISGCRAFSPDLRAVR